MRKKWAEASSSVKTISVAYSPYVAVEGGGVKPARSVLSNVRRQALFEWMRVFLAFLALVWVCVPEANAVSYMSEKSGPSDKNDVRLKVVTTFTIIADMARNVAGDGVSVESITKPGAEIHGYEPTPRDILRTRDADLILENGLFLERWFERFLLDVGDIPRVTISEGVKPISIYAGPYSGKPNPHAWMSTNNALIYIENIRKALAERDPEHAAVYALNADRYATEVKAVGEDLRNALNAIPESQRMLVTSEGAFSYLARDMGMKEAYIWPINADQQGTPKQVRHVIDLVRKESVPVIFSESTVSNKGAKRIAQETGALYGGVLYVDSLSEADGPVPTYLDLMRITTQTIAKGFRGTAPLIGADAEIKAGDEAEVEAGNVTGNK